MRWQSEKAFRSAEKKTEAPCGNHVLRESTQTKLFTVMIRPYISITEDKGMFHHDFQTVTGYQYQLLVNGIPAFSPHVVAEQTEVKKALNPEVERLLVQTTERAADAAITLYLGGSTQFAKLAEPIIKRLPK